MELLFQLGQLSQPRLLIEEPRGHANNAERSVVMAAELANIFVAVRSASLPVQATMTKCPIIPLQQFSRAAKQLPNKDIDQFLRKVGLNIFLASLAATARRGERDWSARPDGSNQRRSLLAAPWQLPNRHRNLNSSL